MAISKRELPAYVRRCWQAAKTANRKLRDHEQECLRFYVGGELQWRDDEVTRRRQQQRPIITVNKCKPAVDQIEGDIRLNPPGPQVHPVGETGADKDTADIQEGLIREVEYRSGAATAYATAGKYVASSGWGVLELDTEYCDDRSWAQRCVINAVEDPESVLFDPVARKANRQDASWAMRLRMFDKDTYIAKFGKGRKVLEPAGIQNAMGWIADALGVSGSIAEIREWTGNGKGPYFVAEFSTVELEPDKLTLHTDNVSRFADEAVPKGVKPKADQDGKPQTRNVLRRKIRIYTVDALEVLDETDWLGSLHKWIPVVGPEVYIKGELHRLSLISGAIDSQRALNYAATSAIELVGLMPRAPYLGPEGSFDNAKWATLNTEMWTTLEYTPVWATSETGQQELLPPPTRNMFETALQGPLELTQFFSDSIKAVTAIYDPSLGQQKGDQSGKAIEQLRSESSVGNYSYSDNLHRAIAVLYQQIIEINCQILDGPRVVTIVRPDSQHEIIEINKEFPEGGVDTGQSKPKANNICQGQYAARAKAGPSYDTRQDEALAMIMEFFKVNPQAAANPGVAAGTLRMIGEGNPKVEQIADLIQPPTDGSASPQQLGQQLQQAQAQNNMLVQAVQKLQQALLAKLPEQETKKWIAVVNAIAGIREAEIKAGVDQAQMDVGHLETLTGFAHDAATQATEHEHAKQIQASDQAHATAAQASDQAHATMSQQSEQQAAADQAEAQPAGANQ